MGNLMTPASLGSSPSTFATTHDDSICPPSVWKVGLQRFAQQDAMNGFGLPGPIDGAPRLRPRNGDRSVKVPGFLLGC